ncbi:MAG: DNA-deoxyinosine glycosylase [Clostridiales bacterium]|jgi:hypoxanthine-DNA glycosylase|nr:DNA-deoxyinosine glycosylase [Clostridiales bacterium]
MEVIHTISPVFDENSKILILGTMPSPKSREVGFYYGHKQNKFWRVMSDLFNMGALDTIESKKKFLLDKKIALWDTLKSCDIDKADDSTIKNPVVNDFSIIFDKADIKKVFTTGKKAYALYTKHCLKFNKGAFCLPSTSPSNCRLKYEDLLAQYKIILDYL